MRDRVEAYLKDISAKERGMKRLQERIEEKRLDIQGLRSPKYGEISSKAVEDRLGAAFDALDDLKAQWAQLAQDYSDALANAIDVCDVTKDHRWICFKHYVDGWTWSQCAEVINFSSGYVKNILAPKGIKEIFVLMPEEWRSLNIPDACPHWDKALSQGSLEKM